MIRVINPFLSNECFTTKRSAKFARLPLAPINASPVPHLTSLYHFSRAGEYGDRSYPGNCGGNLIRDLLLYFQPQNVLDPMTGSGTCTDVCKELAIPCVSLDIRNGFDATNPESFRAFGGSRFDFIWAHPPYWRQKRYTSHSGDLSGASTLTEASSCTRLLPLPRRRR